MLAVCFNRMACARAYAAQNIFPMSHRLKMMRVDAGTNAALVIQLKS